MDKSARQAEELLEVRHENRRLKNELNAKTRKDISDGERVFFIGMIPFFVGFMIMSAADEGSIMHIAGISLLVAGAVNIAYPGWELAMSRAESYLQGVRDRFKKESSELEEE